MTNARSLANFATGIGTEGAVLTVDNTNNRIGIATTNPQNDLQVGLGITMEGDTGQVTFVGIVTAGGFRNSDGSVVGAASTDNINTSTLAQFAGGVGIADSIFHLSDDNTAIRFPAADTFTVTTSGSERLRVTGIGSVGIGDASPENTLTIKNIGSFEGDANSFYFGSNFTGTGTKFIGSGKHAQRFFLNNASANGYLRYDNTGTTGNAGDTITWQERFRITSAGLVGINTASPAATLEVASTGTCSLNLVADSDNDGAANDSFIAFHEDSNSGTQKAAIKYDASQTNFGIETNGSRALSIDTSQRLLIGATSTRGTHGGGNAQLQVEGTNTATAGMSITRTSDDAGSPTFSFGKTRNGSALSDGDDVGVIYWQGDDGTDLHTALCSIKGEVDGSVSGNTVPGRITFNTATSSTNLSERLRITSGGDVGIGSETPARKLDVNGPVRVIETVEAYDTSGGDQDWFVSSASFGFHNGTGVAFNAGGGLFRLGISGSEKVRVDVGGNVNITGITTASQFDATSDVALKENIEVIDEPITKISELKGVTFDWKKGGHSVGVIAQDVEKVLPTAVGGSKDQKTVNYNAIIGLLVESVKDQQKQIEELKSLLDK